MKMCLVMILVMKVFIFSKTMIICLLCPLLCGLFFFWKGAKGELSYKVKKHLLRCIVSDLYFRWTTLTHHFPPFWYKKSRYTKHISTLFDSFIVFVVQFQLFLPLTVHSLHNKSQVFDSYILQS